MPSKTMQGEVVSDKMMRSRVVKVTMLKRHAKYRKQYKVFKRFQAHDERDETHIGDRVEIAETRPYSKNKRWKIVRKLQ